MTDTEARLADLERQLFELTRLLAESAGALPPSAPSVEAPAAHPTTEGRSAEPHQGALLPPDAEAAYRKLVDLQRRMRAANDLFDDAITELLEHRTYEKGGNLNVSEVARRLGIRRQGLYKILERRKGGQSRVRRPRSTSA